MTTLAQVRDGLEARLRTIAGLEVVAFVPDDVPGYPAAIVYPPVAAAYRGDLGMGGFAVEFVILLMVPSAIDRSQLDLYDLLDRTGPGSVFAAIEADTKLGGLNVTCHVVDAADPLERGQMASTQVYQRTITVQAFVS